MKYFIEYSTQRGLKAVSCKGLVECMRKSRQLNGLAATLLSYQESEDGALFLVARQIIDGREAYPAPEAVRPLKRSPLYGRNYKLPKNDGRKKK